MVTEGYAKDVAGVVLDYMPSDIRDYDGTDFDVRITFGDDPLEDAFWVTVPAEAERLTLRELLDRHVLGATREDRERIAAALDTDTNPDLPELYLAVRRAFDDLRRGKAVVRFHINKGPRDVSLDEPAMRHFSRAFSRAHGFDYRLIDLVLDVTDIPGAGIPPERQEELRREFRALLLLYLMDRYGRDFAFEGRNFDVIGVEAVADWAVRQGWLDLSAKEVQGQYRGVYVRTEAGNRLVRAVVRETDDLIAKYDHFADVTVDEEPPRFRTGRGEDLRLHVYRAEGIDPLRGAFLMNLENGFYDEGWERVFADDAWFRELLRVATAPCPVPPQKLERIIRAGKAWAVRRRGEAGRAEHGDRLWWDATRG
jgi:hypothetical protein